MTLPGETIATGAPDKCDEPMCENRGPQVLVSAAGYYIGYSCRLCGPYSRESGYYEYRAEAQAAMDRGEYSRL
tara:strand:+ start:1122 stop:1340 length:219 start_codon:yes stop_codon:yes gene_type:complete